LRAHPGFAIKFPVKSLISRESAFPFPIPKLVSFSLAARFEVPCDPGDNRANRRTGTMATEARLLTAQFLKWVASRPRTRLDVQDAWGSTCPLNCAWEDAISDDLVRFGGDGRLTLTERGQAVLDHAG